MDSSRIFNTATLLHFTENDRVISAQLLEMALADMPAFFNSAAASIAEGSPADAARWIHKIKGVAGTIGAETVYTLSFNLDARLKSGDTAAKEDMDLLGSAVDEFCSSPEVADWIADV